VALREGAEVSDKRQVSGVRWGVGAFAWPLLVVAVMAIAWPVAERLRGEEDVVTAARDLEAYHRIEAKDLTTAEVGRPLPEGVLRDSEKIVGTVTRKALEKGARLHSSDVTKVVDAGSFEGVRLRLRPRRASIVGAKPGDLVSLRLAPTADGADVEPDSIPALLIDTSGKEGAVGDPVVIVKEDVTSRLLRLVGRSDLLITPTVRAAAPPPAPPGPAGP
jgi:SAF domain